MVDSIKITALQDIGGNITYNTLVPVVNMVGIPTTQKSNLQNLGNFILNNAGGSYFPRAAQANLALSVANAAQPNITSVGTLANLTVSGNVNLGAVGNVRITGGTSGQVLSTNGNGVLSWTSAGTTYGNSNVANYLPTFTGNLRAGNLIGLANANLTIYSNAGAHDFTFGDDGTFYCPDNAVIGGTSIAIGPGANSLVADLADAVLVASSNSNAYVQAVLTNVSDIGSADWVAQGHHGNDSGGWCDMGFTSSFYSDVGNSMFGPGTGYVIVNGYLPGQAPAIGTGSLILSTGEDGTEKDVIFGTGGGLTSNIFGRISHANNALELTRANSNIKLSGGGGIIGSGNLAIGVNGNVTIQANTGTAQTWTFGSDGAMDFPVRVYANLPAATNAGQRAFISNANLVAVGNFGAVVAGGGSNTVPVWSDGTNWRIG
jgi:hypothetical protein